VTLTFTNMMFKTVPPTRIGCPTLWMSSHGRCHSLERKVSFAVTDFPSKFLIDWPVTDMLIAILNTCSKEELEEETPSSIMSGPSSPEIKTGALDPDSTEFKRRAIKNKILAIGRLSRVFQVLREESERVTELKTASGGRLPAGTLMLGAEGIKQAIHSFEDARKVDLQNERLPPSHDEVRKSHDTHRTEALAKASKDADNDQEIRAIARRVSL
jgi:serine/threonine-protein phosphatase 2B catalytic subunit